LAPALIRIGVTPGEWRIALLIDGVLTEFALWRPGSPDGFGDIHLGQVTAVVPALAGAFVAIGGAEGFLPDRGGLTEGQILTVRVIRAAQGGKGPRLAVLSSPQPEGKPRLLTRGPSPLDDLAARHADAPIEVDDAHFVPALRGQFGARVRPIGCAFAPELEEAVAALAEASVALPGGAVLHIEATRALTAIDIDAGTATAQRTSKSAAQTALNRSILPELARQIRLRNLSGAIVIDLAGMPARRRVALAPLLADALAADPLKPRLLGFTALGFAEISRPRQRAPLHEWLATPLSAGLIALRAAAGQPARPLRLRAAPIVIAALEADGQGIADLARRSVHKIFLRSDPALSGHHWVLEEIP
jgi:hypothetical protein